MGLNWNGSGWKQPTQVQIVDFSTFTVTLSLSKNTVHFIFRSTTFWRLDCVSVFR
jgi:hypothetical protein